MASSLMKAAAAAVLFSSPALAGLGKPTLFSDGLSPHVDSVFWEHLTPTQSTYDRWDWGWIPETCLNHANDNNVSPYDMEIYNVHYTDCGSAFVFCRHNAANLGIVDMIDLFGRLPIHERQYITNVIAVPGGGSAYETSAIVVFQGPVGTPSVFQHEVGHAVDSYHNDVGSSETDLFKNAINADSCVPDDYANSSNAEDYTQNSVLALYEIVNPGGLDPIGNWRCLENQKNAVSQLQGDAMIPGGQCTFRWADAAIVSMGPATGNGKRAVGAKPTPGLVAGAPGVKEIPFEHKSKVTQYKNLHFNEAQSANAPKFAVERRKVAFRG
ncbi:hypothetical protein V494_03439 [Pseudogymnoascus sp. VKM F-4513 (FW-928)]|nr:hypothetical protein V494_03439 [Pseudogymnoascus sp. VKM F-4513 (FW-928)]